MKRYKHIFFDLDGTIIDSYKGIAATVEQVAKELNIDIPTSEYRSFIGPPVGYSFARFMNAEKVVEAHALFREIYLERKLMMDFKLYDGIKETLEGLKKLNPNLYVATSKREEPSVEILTSAELIDCFVRVFGAALNGRKEKHEVLRYALDELQADPSECVLIGDTMFDVNGAKAVGLDCIAVTYGFGDRETLQKSAAICLAEKPEDLLKLFKQ